MTRRLLVFAAFVIGAVPVAAATNRHVAIVVDTSNSMRGNDPPRYTMQLAQVLSDLVDSGDELSVTRMPGDFFSSCSSGPSSSLVLKLDPNDRTGFKRQLDTLIRYDTGTYFAAPIRTAISILERDRSAQRMLLVIADAGGLGDCEAVLTRELLDLKREGVTIAAINLGGSAGAFDRNPAFDFTTAALDSHGLVEAVALVYQRFLGAKKVQTGQVGGDITVEIAPLVDEAFLIVAADGPIGELTQISGNGAAKIDLNFRGGGATKGLDGVLRGYRIVRMERPASGRWQFRASNAAGAGWMLLQDSAVGVRVVSSTTIPKGVDAPLEVELFDQRTGQKITDTSKLSGLQVNLEVDGRTVTFHDDGQAGDQKANDGTLTATTKFDRVGQVPVGIHLQSDFLDRNIAANVNIIDATWQIEVTTPKRTEVDQPVDLSVRLKPIGSPAALRPPQRVDVLTGGPVPQLHDDGQGKDEKAGDRIFSGSWKPTQTGTFHLDYVAVGGSVAAKASAPLEVIGRLRFGPSNPIRLGRVKSETVTNAKLDLGSADVRGTFDLQVTTAFDQARSALEIDTGNGWVQLGREPQTVRLTDGGARTWPVRLRVGECPEAHPAGKPFELVIAGTNADGKAVRTTVPVTVEIVADSWLHCWWPVLAIAGGLIVLGIIIYGYWSPSRFPPRLGVVLSPEEDMNEGFFHPIRGTRGSGSGFYRDARIYICQDFRLSPRPRNALARLRADRKLVRIEPIPGAAVWRMTADGTWDQIAPGESSARFGDLYRNDPATLFFELRNA